MNNAMSGRNPPRPPCRLDTLIKDDIAESFINSIQVARKGIILVTGEIAAGKTLLATAIAGELSQGKNRVYYMANPHESSCYGYGADNWTNVQAKAHQPIAIEEGTILLLDQPVQDWNVARFFSRVAIVIVTLQDDPVMWQLMKRAKLDVLKTVHAINHKQRLRRTACIYNGLVDPADLANTVLDVQGEHFLAEQETIPLPACLPATELKDAIRKWANHDLAVATKVFTDAYKNGS